MAQTLQKRSKHSPPVELPEPLQQHISTLNRLQTLPPIPGPKPWSDDVERAALWHTSQSAPPVYALCASGISKTSAESYLSDTPPEAYESACRALVERLKEAESAAAATCFGRIHAAGADPKFWTANAWILERKHGYVAQQTGIAGPSVVVNIGQLNISSTKDTPTVQLLEGELIKALPEPDPDPSL